MVREMRAAEPMVIPDRPSRPLVVKCGYAGTSRRITFPSAATSRLESLRTRVEECFSLSASPFYLSYADDDGEEFPIRSEADLTEAIAYFNIGDDESIPLSFPGDVNSARALSIPTQRIILRVDVVVEYDGPSLSDTSSIASFRSTTDAETYDEEGSQLSWRSSGYTESSRYARSGPGAQVSYGETPHNPNGEVPPRRQSSAVRLSNVNLYTAANDSRASDLSLPPTVSEQLPSSFSEYGRRSDKARSQPASHDPLTPQALKVSHIPRPSPSQSQMNIRDDVHPPLIGLESDSVPSLLTHSELGSRWLREQSKLTRRNVASGPRNDGHGNRRYASDDESLGSDEELGDLALVRDARGKYYYSYQSSETSSLSSNSELDLESDRDQAGPSTAQPISYSLSLSLSSSKTSPPATPDTSENDMFPHNESGEPSGLPIVAPDCSACGIRLDYMRYVCQTCGEGNMWIKDAPGKSVFVPLHIETSSSGRSEGSAADTDLVSARTESLGSSGGSQTVYNVVRSRSGSMSTNFSSDSDIQVSGGTLSDSPSVITTAQLVGRNSSQVRTSDRSFKGDHEPAILPRQLASRGYELCVGCIELHGTNHSKAASKAAKASMRGMRSNGRGGELRHTFREKIWGPRGWTDIDYSDEAECTICRTLLFCNRFKCVSCPKFDLCRSCYQKVDEIHPAHTFLSVPDHSPPESNSLQPNNLSRGNGDKRIEPATKLVRHPGAFCHNCLQDIVGPRFHCAVCPSWDLCIQCEAVAASGDGSHTAEHIMMKIPIPLASAEVELVSRRARDRWFYQDSTTVAVAASNPQIVAASLSSRSSSPTNETVYGGSTVPATNGSVNVNQRSASLAVMPTTRDALDHGARCSNCHEWIMGRRFQCANCPSDPEPYNLCSICELRSYRIHDPRHVFFKFDRPVHSPLQSVRPLLPLLYKTRVGEVPEGAVINPRDPIAYLKHVLHRETVCDIHANQIRGIWLRCAHCAAGFDICQEAEQTADHDSTHVFVVFKARVDMAAFRALADLGATHSKPLLRKQVYVS